MRFQSLLTSASCSASSAFSSSTFSLRNCNTQYTSMFYLVHLNNLLCSTNAAKFPPIRLPDSATFSTDSWPNKFSITVGGARGSNLTNICCSQIAVPQTFQKYFFFLVHVFLSRSKKETSQHVRAKRQPPWQLSPQIEARASTRASFA